MINTPPWDDIDRLVDEGFVLTTNKNVPYIYFLYLNMKHGPLQDIRVRTGDQHGDRPRGHRPRHLSRHRAAEYGMLSPGTDAYDPELQQLRLRPGRAKKLMAEAGHADGFKTLFHFPQYGTGKLVETWIQRDLKKIGIDVELKKSEWITYMGDWAGGLPDEVGISEIGWGMSTPSWTGIVSRCDSAPPERRQFGLVLQPGGRQAARPRRS